MTTWRFWTSWHRFGCTLWRSQLLCSWCNLLNYLLLGGGHNILFQAFSSFMLIRTNGIFAYHYLVLDVHYDAVSCCVHDATLIFNFFLLQAKICSLSVTLVSILFTARVCSMTGGNVFTLSTICGGEGTPPSRSDPRIGGGVGRWGGHPPPSRSDPRTGGAAGQVPCCPVQIPGWGGAGWVPLPLSRSDPRMGGGAGNPHIQVRSQDRGQGGVGTPHPGQIPGWGWGQVGWGGHPPVQVRSQDEGQVPPCPGQIKGQGGREGGYPHPGQIPGWGGGYPLLEQHSVYLLRGGQCAFCVHAGGLSCLFHIFALMFSVKKTSDL